MSETSIFGGRILPTLQPYTTIHPASPPVAPQTAWRRRRDSHLCCDLSDLWRRKTWLVLGCPWFDDSFINSHMSYGCCPHLATLTYLKFQLDVHLHLAGEDVDMLETLLQHLCYPWRPFSEPILRSAIQTGPKHVAWEMLPVRTSVNLRKNRQTLLGGAVVFGYIYLCI